MKKNVLNAIRALVAVGALHSGLLAQSAHAVPVSFTTLTGLTGGAPAETAVFRADLEGAGIGSVLSITIVDDSGALGGSPGQFSGFDLDAIKLSNTLCATAACAAAAPALGGFDFAGAGTLFTPGAQRAPVAPKLFGTGAGGNTVDDTVATLAAFDANSTTGPTANGFVSMGDNGRLSFNLLSALSTMGLYLYIGEVGNNGEVAASDIFVQDTRVVPEPGSLSLIGLAMIAAMATRRVQSRRKA